MPSFGLEEMYRSSSSRQGGKVGSKEFIAGAKVGVACAKTHRCEKHDSELSIAGAQSQQEREQCKMRLKE